MGKRTIIIDLDNSLYAHEFVNEQQIHQEDLDKAIIEYQKRTRKFGAN